MVHDFTENEQFLAFLKDEIDKLKKRVEALESENSKIKNALKKKDFPVQ